MSTKTTIPVEVYNGGGFLASFNVSIENLVAQSFPVWPTDEDRSAAVKACAETLFASQKPLIVILGRAVRERQETSIVGYQVKRVFIDDILVEERPVLP